MTPAVPVETGRWCQGGGVWRWFRTERRDKPVRDTRPARAPPFLAPGDRRFPLLIRIADLADFLAKDESHLPAEAPQWLTLFLAHQSRAFGWRLVAAFFERLLADGNCLVACLRRPSGRLSFVAFRDI